MASSLLPSFFVQHAGFRKAVDFLRYSGSLTVGGLAGSSGCVFFRDVLTELQRPALCVLPTPEATESACDDLRSLVANSSFEVIHFPVAEHFPCHHSISVANSERLSAILALRSLTSHSMGASSLPSSPLPVIVASIAALLQKVQPPESIERSMFSLKVGQQLRIEELVSRLIETGFSRTAVVEIPGEFSIRGGIADVFPPGAALPLRIEFFGDVIESIREFAPDTQVSTRKLDVIRFATPTSVNFSSGHDAGEVPEPSSFLLDYLHESFIVALFDPTEIQQRAASFLNASGIPTDTYDGFISALMNRSHVMLSPTPRWEMGCVVNIHCELLPIFPRGSFSQTAQIISEMVWSGSTITVVCNNSAQESRLFELFADTKIPDVIRSRITVEIGSLSRGFECVALKRVVIPHHELFNRFRTRRVVRKQTPSRNIDDFAQLEPGCLVVHDAYGIGRFLGIERIKKRGREQEFIAIEYQDDVKIYVPVENAAEVERYIGIGDKPVQLSKVGTAIWQSRKESARQAVEGLAKELLSLQAARVYGRGIAYPPDTDWQREFEASFIYEETPDQVRVVEELKADMMRPRPMDRLICGDVGYGKTEVAMRAAFKAVTFGKQVAVLVPTTILAQQHGQTFSERMADYPIVIEVLSRFRSRSEQKMILERLAEGRIDIIIGTHRLIQPDVRFKDLGLVIIDEEQRFGVEHKERLKRMRATVDVLTLTATPIPRTLHMSLIGLRDISIMETPPDERLAVVTQMITPDPARIRNIIINELNRGGQVFFIHNRVHNIDAVKRALEKIVPEARFEVVHGQLRESLLEERMMRFIHGEVDVLVTTTIVESGLDIPNANTMIVNDAHEFGLADLHQLRGRVGRYKNRAYCYYVVPKDRPISDDAQKRLKAIRELSDLGAGFKIALRDLEIRGAGNLLGKEQHGHIAAVGYAMYCRLLEEAVRTLKDGRQLEFSTRSDVDVDIAVEAYIPEGYLPDPVLRLEIYREISRLDSIESLRELRNAIRDRFGPIPELVENVLSLAELRIRGRAAGMTSICQADEFFILKFRDADWLKKFARKRRRVRPYNDTTAFYPTPGLSEYSSKLVIATLARMFSDEK